MGEGGWSGLCPIRQGEARVKLLRITKHMSPSIPKQATRIVPGGKKN